VSAFQQRREALKRRQRQVFLLSDALHVAAAAYGVPVVKMPVAEVPIRATDFETISMLPLEETLVPCDGQRDEPTKACRCDICLGQRAIERDRTPKQSMRRKIALAFGGGSVSASQ
jgi:hypothetical protein